jgi:hypothetical protein
MHRRIAAFLLGAWILGSLFMMFVATQNFGTVDRVLASAPPTMIRAMGSEHARQLLRYMAGQENQLFFVTWEFAQIVLSAALAALLFFVVGNRFLAILAGGLFLLTAVQRFWVTPEMISLAGQLDTATLASRFSGLHAIYGVIEVLKLLIAVAIGCVLLPNWPSRSRNNAEITAVKYAR